MHHQISLFGAYRFYFPSHRKGDAPRRLGEVI